MRKKERWELLLVVEDYADFVIALTRYLRSANHPFAVARSASEAQAVFSERGSEAWTGLLVDPGLPEGIHAGVEFLRWTRPRAPGLPAVCVSGQLSPELLTTVNKLGAQLVTKVDTPLQLPWFLERTTRYAKTRVDAIVARAAAEHDLTPAESLLLAALLKGANVAQYRAAAKVTRSTYDKHRRAVLEKTGDADTIALAMRLWRRALEEAVA